MCEYCKLLSGDREILEENGEIKIKTLSGQNIFGHYKTFYQIIKEY